MQCQRLGVSIVGRRAASGVAGKDDEDDIGRVNVMGDRIACAQAVSKVQIGLCRCTARHAVATAHGARTTDEVVAFVAGHDAAPDARPRPRCDRMLDGAAGARNRQNLTAHPFCLGCLQEAHKWPAR